MLGQISTILAANVEEITRRWVAELRRTGRTQVHKQMLTAEIANGVKSMLTNLALAIERREAPDDETVPAALLAEEPPTTTPFGDQMALRTMPLTGPLARAMQAAVEHGKLRHNQGYDLHEVILEYIKLRQIVWDTLSSGIDERGAGAALALDLTGYLDRLLDELMLTTIENFYHSSVRDLETRAVRDPLTQLYNKEYFHRRLQQELHRAQRDSDEVGVAMIDVDRLKPVNDTYGHQAGDAVIIAVAAAIRETCRRTDLPSRYGGDEFAVILPGTGKLHARYFAERVLRAVRDLAIPPLIVPAPSVSIGIASFPEDARTVEILIAKADAALYRAKRAGRNQFSL